MPAVGPKLTLTGSMPGSGGTGSAAVDSISHEQEREQVEQLTMAAAVGAVLCKVWWASKEDERRKAQPHSFCSRACGRTTCVVALPDDLQMATNSASGGGEPLVKMECVLPCPRTNTDSC